jgi:hypothetical protein
MTAVNSPLTLHSRLITEVCKYVYLTDEAKRAYKKKLAEESSESDSSGT